MNVSFFETARYSAPERPAARVADAVLVGAGHAIGTERPEAGGEPGFRLRVPAHDTPEVLSRYAERYGATGHWWFLTGEERVIYCLAREGFRLGVVDPRASEPLECGSRSWLSPAPVWASHGSQGLVMHSARVVLVDPAAQIRAYAVATDADSMKMLLTNLRAVLSEAQQNRGGG